MTIALVTPRIQPTTDGATTAFTVSFPVLNRDHLRVYVDDSLQVEGPDYTLSGTVNREGDNGFESGFTLTMASAPSASQVLTIYREVPPTQETRYYAADAFLAEVPERSWDKLTMLAQDIAELGGLLVTTPVTGPETGSGRSPVPVAVGNAILFGIQVDNQDGTYKAVQVEWDGYVWYAVGTPIITEELAELNGCQDTEVGDVVIGYPLTNSTAGVSYRFAAVQPCDDESGDPGPEQSSPYYTLTDCDGVEDDIVTSANLTRLVGSVINSGGVCYIVTESGSGDGSVDGVSVTSAHATCVSCDDASGDLPDLPNVYAQMARCSDDELVDFWLPELQFGLPGDEDLTKTYEYMGVCYYVSNVRADTPGILFPSGAASVYNDCTACEAALDPPCTACDPTGAGSPPNDAVLAGFSNKCFNSADHIGSYNGFTTPANACVWEWFDDSGPSGQFTIFVIHATGVVAWSPGSPASDLALVAGEWGIYMEANNGAGGSAEWSTKTSSFACAGGKVWGSQAMGAPKVSAGGCADTPTITVAA